MISYYSEATDTFSEPFTHQYRGVVALMHRIGLESFLKLPTAFYYANQDYEPVFDNPDYLVLVYPFHYVDEEGLKEWEARLKEAKHLLPSYVGTEENSGFLPMFFLDVSNLPELDVKQEFLFELRWEYWK